MISTRSEFRKQGFSLIEVAIALAIFVIGALAIIRIFPGALSVITNNGDQLTANNLNRSVIARLKSESAVPDATFNVNLAKWVAEFQAPNVGTADHAGSYEDAAVSVAGVPRLNVTLPDTDIQNLEQTALGKYRGIVGEQATIISVSGVNAVLTQFPVSVVGDATNAEPLPVALSQDYTLENVRIGTDGTLDLNRASDADDPTNAPILNPPTENLINPQSLFYVSYRYRDSNGKIWGVSQEAVRIPTNTVNPTLADTSAVKVKPPVAAMGMDQPGDAANANSVVPEAVSVRLRRFIGVGTFATPGNTPAERVARVADARRGLVTLPPIADPPPLPPLPPTYKLDKPTYIDYVADWSVLLQDGVPAIAPEETPTPVPATPTPVPGYNYRQIALGAPFIEDQADVAVYSLLLDPIASSNGLQTFTAYRSASGSAVEPAPADKLVKPTEDDLRQGQVTFEMPSGATRARVAYRTRDGWIQQMSVAATAYKPYVAGDTEPWRDCVVGADGYIYFHAGEAGKSLNISYTYAHPGTQLVNGTQQPYPDYVVTSRPFVISEELVNAAGLVPAAFSATKVARLQPTNLQGKTLPNTTGDGDETLTSIQAVRGSSVTLRTAYLNGSRYTQSLLSSDRKIEQQ